MTFLKQKAKGVLSLISCAVILEGAGTIPDIPVPVLNGY
jgi:hypothetical protein